MRAIYTKRSFKNNDKYRIYWSKQGYLCDQIHSQYVRLDYDWSNKKHPDQKFSQHLINAHDYLTQKLLNSLQKNGYPTDYYKYKYRGYKEKQRWKINELETTIHDLEFKIKLLEIEVKYK